MKKPSRTPQIRRYAPDRRIVDGGRIIAERDALSLKQMNVATACGWSPTTQHDFEKSGTPIETNGFAIKESELNRLLQVLNQEIEIHNKDQPKASKRKSLEPSDLLLYSPEFQKEPSGQLRNDGPETSIDWYQAILDLKSLIESSPQYLEAMRSSEELQIVFSAKSEEIETSFKIGTRDTLRSDNALDAALLLRRFMLNKEEPAPPHLTPEFLLLLVKTFNFPPSRFVKRDSEPWHILRSLE